LITFFVFRGEAGHDYATIDSKSLRELVVEKIGTPEIIDNPEWKK